MPSPPPRSRYSVLLLGGASDEFVSIKASNLKVDPIEFTTPRESDATDATETDEAHPQRAAGANGAVSVEDLAALPIRDLRAMAAAAGLDTTGCVEKGDYVQLIAAAAGV